MATSKIKSDSIDTIAATKLTGTVDNARITLDAAEVPNLDASKITTGTIADARVPASAVTQHVTATDLSPVENDLAILALQNAVNSNITAHGLQNSWIEQFEDSGSITALTNCARNSTSEYISSVSAATITSTTKLLIESDTTNGSTTFTDRSSVGRTITANSSISHTTSEKKFGTSSIHYNGGTSWLYTDDAADLRFGTSVHTIEFWFKQNSSENGHFVNKWIAGSYDSFYIHVTGSVLSVKANSSGSSWDINTNGSTNVVDNVWHHCACTLNGTALTLWLDGASELTGTVGNSGQIYDGTGKWTLGGQHQDGNNPYTGYMEDIHFSTDVKYTGSFTPTQAYPDVVSSTGSFTSTTITPQDSASKSSLGLVILYKNNAGTNTLNTDVICKVSADNGSNYSTCILASKGTFSTGINIAIAPAISVTAGTQLKYKVEFANQASGSKEAQIHGVALQY